MSRLFLTLLSLVLIPSIFAQDARVVTTITTDAKPAWKTWHAHDCSVNYPGAWSVDTVSGKPVLVRFQGQASTGQNVQVILKITDLDGLTPTDFHSENGPDRVAKTVKDAKIIASTGPDDSGAYTMDYVGDVDGARLHQREEVSFHGDKAYVLTYSGAPADYDEQLFMAEAVLNSFTCPAAK